MENRFKQTKAIGEKVFKYKALICKPDNGLEALEDTLTDTINDQAQARWQLLQVMPYHIGKSGIWDVTRVYLIIFKGLRDIPSTNAAIIDRVLHDGDTLMLDWEYQTRLLMTSPEDSNLEAHFSETLNAQTGDSWELTHIVACGWIESNKGQKTVMGFLLTFRRPIYEADQL